MGSISRYSTAEGQRYRVRYRKPDNSQTDKRGFKTKREAEVFLATVEVSKAGGTYVDPSHSKVTIAELGEPWLLAKRASLKPSAYAPVETAWRIRVNPRWGKVVITAITHSDVKAWIAELNRQAGATVVLRTYGVLAAILDDAVHDRRLTTNPARGGQLGLPRKMASKHTYLTHLQVEKMATASGDRGTLVRVLAYTGMRWSEVSALRAEHVDLVRSRIWIVENAVEVQGTIYVGTPKSHKVRHVPLPRFLRDELAARITGLPPDALVFSGPTGGHMKRTRTSAGSKSWFKNAAAAAGAPTLTVHDLRHTAASLAVQSGANVKAVQRMLGHASAAMTLDVYADLFDDDLDAVSTALDRARATQIIATSSATTGAHRSLSGP